MVLDVLGSERHLNCKIQGSMSKLKNIELQLAKSGKLSLDVSDESASTVFQHFIRGYMGRKDLARTLVAADDDFEASLERVRTYLSRQLVTDALGILKTIKPKNEHERNEYGLELGRCHFFCGDFKACIEELISLLKSKNLSPVTLMTTQQLIGRSYFLLGQTQEAEDALLKSADLSLVFPFADSGFVAKAYLVHFYSESKNQMLAKKFLDMIDLDLHQKISNDLWLSRKLIGLRALSHYQRAFGAVDDLAETLNLGLTIAHFINDQDMVSRCTSDLRELQISPEIGKVLKQFQGWSYISKLKTILKNHPQEVIKLEKSSQIAEILEVLVKGPVDQQELFSQVWKLPYQSHYANNLRATLSKVRKYLPPTALTVHNGMVILQ